MKQTIKNIIDFIRQNKGKSFINIYPYFGVIDENGIIEDVISEVKTKAHAAQILK